MSAARTATVAIGGGVAIAASLPPWGFWPLAFVGFVAFDRVIADQPRARRWRRAWLVWAAVLFPSILWMRDLTLPGYVIASVTFAGFLAAGTVLAPAGIGRYLAVPGGIVVAEWIRWRWPFGGVPLSNLAIGQVPGPLAPILRLGGALLLVAVTATAGMAVAALVGRRIRIGIGLAVVVVAVSAVSALAPDGDPTGVRLDVALVQGGGPQGTRAVDTDPREVMERHLVASAQITDDEDLDLVLWPEDVVDVSRLEGSEEGERLRELARRVGTTVVAGIVEDSGADRFRNYAAVFEASGDITDRYEKVERVPFGEWVPFRGLLERVAGDALPSRDAVIGEGPAVVDTPVGRLAVSISWEIFFGERARDGVRHGGRLLVNPTNGASFSGTQVQTQQVASSRMRAIETGRWVVQIAPTGFSAVVSPDGEVRQRTAVSEQAVLRDTVELRTGQTLYVRFGDTFALAYAALALAAGWAVHRRDRSALTPRS